MSTSSPLRLGTRVMAAEIGGCLRNGSSYCNIEIDLFDIVSLPVRPARQPKTQDIPAGKAPVSGTLTSVDSTYVSRFRGHGKGNKMDRRVSTNTINKTFIFQKTRHPRSLPQISEEKPTITTNRGVFGARYTVLSNYGLAS